MRKYVVLGLNIVATDADYQLQIIFAIQGIEQEMLSIIDSKDIHRTIHGKGIDEFNLHIKRLIEFLEVASEGVRIYKTRLGYSGIDIPSGYLRLRLIIVFDESKKSVRDVYNNIYGKWEYDHLIERAEFIDFLTKFIEAVDSSDPEV